MALQFTFSNILQLFSAIAPLLLAFFLVMASIFNQDIKGLVYLSGVLLALVINIPIMNQIGSKMDIEKASTTCNIIELPLLSNYNSPSPSSLFLGFTTSYLLLPMNYNGQINYVVLASLLCLMGLDMFTKVTKYCTTWAGSILGILIGLILGAIWFTVFKTAGYDSLLYFNELASNNVQCSKPSKQTFKCSVYKNGELVSSNIA